VSGHNKSSHFLIFEYCKKKKLYEKAIKKQASFVFLSMLKTAGVKDQSFLQRSLAFCIFTWWCWCTFLDFFCVLLGVVYPCMLIMWKLRKKLTLPTQLCVT